MTREHYATLGVDAGADAEEIKIAYRQKAKETHPDAGGSAEAFRKVQRAYDTLSDVEHRKRYDETGFDSEDMATLDKAQGIFCQVFAGVVETAPSIECMDLVEAVISGVREEIAKQKAEIEKLPKKSARYREAAKRLRGDGAQFLVDHLNAMAGNVEASRVRLEKFIQVGDELLRIGDRLKYRTDDEKQTNDLREQMFDSFLGKGRRHTWE